MNPKTPFSYRLPSILGIAHGVSDGSAGLLLGSLATNSSATQVTLLVLIYNALGFGSQPLIGYFADSLRSPRVFASGGMMLLASSLIMRGLGSSEVAVFMAGVGSAAFHVGAGALTLRSCGGRSDAAGLFAAPGGRSDWYSPSNGCCYISRCADLSDEAFRATQSRTNHQLAKSEP